MEIVKFIVLDTEDQRDFMAYPCNSWEEAIQKRYELIKYLEADPKNVSVFSVQNINEIFILADSMEESELGSASSILH